LLDSNYNKSLERRFSLGMRGGSIMKTKESELNNIYMEIINKISETTGMGDAYKLGVANTAKYFFDAMSLLEDSGFNEVKTKDIKGIIENAVSSDKEMKSYYERLMNS
jgi:hypothetical protein